MRKTVGTVFLLLLVTMTPQSAQRNPAGWPRLVSIEPLEMCASFPASGPGEAAASLLAELRQDRPQTGGASVQIAKTLERAPLRTIRDSFPTYSAVAVDTANNEIVLQDENLFQIMVYDRLSNTPATASFTEPKRVITGHDTKLEFNCGLYIDPKTGDIYSVNNDTLDTLSIFSRKASGNSKPDRTLHTPHGTYGIAVNEETQELFLTIQHENEVVVHRKMDQGQDKPLRVLAGPHVRLADPHGIGIDAKNQWMFVANYGNAHESKVPGSGTFVPPSINVYALKANGDTPPMRVITGPRTQLNWPAHVYVDQEHGDVFVANDGESSILVFRVTDSGDVAPTRVLKGAKTQIKNPTGIFVDTAHDELVVANMGNHSATVYPRAADGDTAPLRTIRTAPPGKAALQIGNPGSVAYDTKRDAIITPNWVAHPQIAIFARLAKNTDMPQRVIYGQASKLSRTMHAIRYNAARDEFYVGNPFAQAVLTFRGGANGQEAPLRIIQGPKTTLNTPDTLEVDPVHEELLVPEDDRVIVFPVAGNGDTAPLREFHSPAKDGWKAAGGIAVDPIHNVIVLAGTVLGEKNKAGYSSPYGDNREALLIFDRLASGEAQPLRVIRGSKTGMHAVRQIEIQPKGGWIVISQMTAGELPEPEGTYVGVYSINDSGNMPPRWKIDGKPSTGMKKPHGIALDPNHKEVIVADMRMNAILTFYFPEIF